MAAASGSDFAVTVAAVLLNMCFQICLSLHGGTPSNLRSLLQSLVFRLGKNADFSREFGNCFRIDFGGILPCSHEFDFSRTEFLARSHKESTKAYVGDTPTSITLGVPPQRNYSFYSLRKVHTSRSDFGFWISD